MAFPIVQTTNTSVTSPANTSHTINLPAGIVSGDLLIAIFTPDGGAGGTWPGGWTVRFSTGLPASAGWVEAYYRIADGTEGASIAVTTGSSVTASHMSYRISDTNGTAPQSGTTATGTTANADPPTLTPTWGAKDTLWIVVCGVDAATPSAAPTNYTNLITVATNTRLGTARRELNAATEDPGVFTSASDQWAANTIAIEPGGAAAGWGPLLGGQRNRLVVAA